MEPLPLFDDFSGCISAASPFNCDIRGVIYHMVETRYGDILTNGGSFTSDNAKEIASISEEIIKKNLSIDTTVDIRLKMVDGRNIPLVNQIYINGFTSSAAQISFLQKYGRDAETSKSIFIHKLIDRDEYKICTILFPEYEWSPYDVIRFVENNEDMATMCNGKDADTIIADMMDADGPLGEEMNGIGLEILNAWRSSKDKESAENMFQAIVGYSFKIYIQRILNLILPDMDHY